MTLSFRSYLIFLMLLAVVACQTNLAVYERPLLENEILKPSSEGDQAPEPYPYTVASLEPQFRPNIKSVEAGIWMSVEKAEAHTKTAGNRITDERLNNYIRGVVCRLAGEYCNDIRVYVMRVPMFNASMYPNGMMHVWSGLLLRVQNEAQLAAVLGHEIGHYLRRHSLQRFQDIVDKSNALVFVQMGLAVAGVPVAGDLMTLIALGSIAAYSRDHEREADGYGLLLLANAGYSPAEASVVWERVIREKEADPDHKSPSIFEASHPQSEERMEVLEDLAHRVNLNGPTETGVERFDAIMLPMRSKFIRDELHLRKFHRAEFLLDMLIEDWKNVSELHYFKGEIHRLRREDGDLKKALESYKKSVASGSPPPEVHRSMGLVQRRLGLHKDSAVSLMRYLKENPQAEDYKLVKQLIGSP